MAYLETFHQLMSGGCSVFTSKLDRQPIYIQITLVMIKYCLFTSGFELNVIGKNCGTIDEIKRPGKEQSY